MKQLQIKMWAFLLTFLCFNLSYGQEIDLKRLKGISPRSIGPAGMSGRITAIEVDLSNPQIFMPVPHRVDYGAQITEELPGKVFSMKWIICLSGQLP
jgi:hypothetical protein